MINSVNNFQHHSLHQHTAILRLLNAALYRFNLKINTICSFVPSHDVIYSLRSHKNGHMMFARSFISVANIITIPNVN